MLTAMIEDDWAIVLQVFRAVRSRRGDKARYRERRGKNREFPDQFVWIAVGRIGFDSHGTFTVTAKPKIPCYSSKNSLFRCIGNFAVT